MGRERARRYGPGPRALPPLDALTSDLWYTLLYVPPREQHRLDREREKLWSDPLVVDGYGDAEARALLRRFDRWTADREDAGHTPSVALQTEWMTRESGIRFSAREMGRALDRLIAEAEVRVAPGARTTLARLKDRGVRLGLVSNLLHETADGARDVLATLGFAGLFRTLVFSDEHPWSKPSPAPFRYALRQLRVVPARAAHVGDLSYDTRGAAAAGLRPILYTGLHRWEPERLRSLARRVGPSIPRARRWADVGSWVLAGR